MFLASLVGNHNLEKQLGKIPSELLVKAVKRPSGFMKACQGFNFQKKKTDAYVAFVSSGSYCNKDKTTAVQHCQILMFILF